MILNDQVAIFRQPWMDLAEMSEIPVGVVRKARNMSDILLQLIRIQRPAMDSAHSRQ